MPHLLVVPPFLGAFGGLENHVDEFVTVAVDSGYRVTVVSDRPPPGPPNVAERWIGRADVRSAELEWRSTPTGQLTVAAALARDIARRRRWPTPADRRQAGQTRAIPAIEAYWSTGPGADLLRSADLVQLFGKPKPWVCAAIAAAHRIGVPTAYAEIAHVTADYAARPDLRGFHDVASLVDVVICIHDQQAADLRRHFGFEGEAVRVEQWADPHEAALLALSAPAAENEEQRDIIVGSLSRLGPEKGLDTLVRGFARAVVVDRRLRLRIAGTGSEGPATEALAVELGVADRVDMVGFVDDSVQFMSDLDVFIVSSIDEGGPISGIEAMAAARPIVTTPVGAMPERLRDDAEGLRFDVGDDRALATHLVDLASDPGRRAELGAAARRRYLERNHSSVTVPVLVDAWAKLIR